jgi:hypothetical protein
MITESVLLTFLSAVAWVHAMNHNTINNNHANVVTLRWGETPEDSAIQSGKDN